MSRRRLVRFLSTSRSYWQESSRDQRGAVVASTSSTSTSTGLIAGVTAILLGGAAAAATTSAMTTARTTSTASAPTTVRRTACSPASLAVASDKKTKNDVVGDGKELCHTLFVWDFDWTVVNCNSDEYVPAQFLGQEATTQGFLQLYHDNPSTKGNWHACVEQMVNQAMRVILHQQHEEGAAAAATPTDRILDAAHQMPFLIPVEETLQAIHAKNPTGAGQMILSDGNTLFLKAFLQHNMPHIKFTHGIISNHGFWKKAQPPSMHGSIQNNQLSQQENEIDSLCVVHQSQQYGGHDCPRCAANLCKTQALQETLKDYYASSTVVDQSNTTTFPSTVKQRQRRLGGPARIVYIGDGANDACPVLNVLGSGDVLLARVGRKRLHANERQGPESDQEAISNRSISSNKNRDNHDEDDEAESLGSCFGIIPALEKAKLEDPSSVPACQVWEWTTGEELQQLVLKLLQDLPPPSPRDEKE